jgi:hypothetical protein
MMRGQRGETTTPGLNVHTPEQRACGNSKGAKSPFEGQCFAACAIAASAFSRAA